MEREIIYNLNKEFVYKGTQGKEKIKPGTLLISKEKYSIDMQRFLESLYEYKLLDRGLCGFRQSISFKLSLSEIKNTDLRKYPIMLLEDSFFLQGKEYHLFNFNGKELVLNPLTNFHKPLFATAGSLLLGIFVFIYLFSYPAFALTSVEILGLEQASNAQMNEAIEEELKGMVFK